MRNFLLIPNQFLFSRETKHLLATFFWCLWRETSHLIVQPFYLFRQRPCDAGLTAFMTPVALFLSIPSNDFEAVERRRPHLKQNLSHVAMTSPLITPAGR
ncbi:hypothetical protein TNIN_127861 [Trichonephila inaurata madagascariensis]|uniref:Uncharacterized protein n=1 Tax=Trichonephila inaurata madagascariensis TaxID=2747483 RepID=A0A8X7CM92_9ARAC|nr:hypothetical protein TNIN_127861 [Trichonephila inaurata madagascariensis]